MPKPKQPTADVPAQATLSGELLIYLERRQVQSSDLIRVAPPASERLVRVLDQPTTRARLSAQPDVTGVWGPYAVNGAPTNREQLTEDKLLFLR